MREDLCSSATSTNLYYADNSGRRYNVGWEPRPHYHYQPYHVDAPPPVDLTEIMDMNRRGIYLIMALIVNLILLGWSVIV